MLDFLIGQYGGLLGTESVCTCVKNIKHNEMTLLTQQFDSNF